MDQDIEQAWIDEVNRRKKELDSGEVDPISAKEVLASINYYNQKAAAVCDQFYDEVQTTLALLRLFPEIGSSFEASIRKFPLNRFSFALFYKYEEKNNYLEIYAVMRQGRKPGYGTSWK